MRNPPPAIVVRDLVRKVLFVSIMFIACGAVTLFAQHSNKYIISSLQLSGSKHISNETILRSFQTKQGDTLDEAKLSSDIETLVSKYADLGYAFANVEIAKLQPIDSAHISIGIRISEGKPSRLTSCKVEGIAETDTSVIAREFFFKSIRLLLMNY